MGQKFISRCDGSNDPLPDFSAVLHCHDILLKQVAGAIGIGRSDHPPIYKINFVSGANDLVSFGVGVVFRTVVHMIIFSRLLTLFRVDHCASLAHYSTGD